MNYTETLDTLVKSAGFAGAVLAVVAWVFYKLYQQERSDRKEAWKDNSLIMVENNKALNDINNVLEQIYDKILSRKD